jgi:hypothetical protein
MQSASFSVFVPLALTCQNSYTARLVGHGEPRGHRKSLLGFDGRDCPLSNPGLSAIACRARSGLWPFVSGLEALQSVVDGGHMAPCSVCPCEGRRALGAVPEAFVHGVGSGCAHCLPSGDRRDPRPRSMSDGSRAGGLGAARGGGLVPGDDDRRVDGSRRH